MGLPNADCLWDRCCSRWIGCDQPIKSVEREASTVEAPDWGCSTPSAFGIVGARDRMGVAANLKVRKGRVSGMEGGPDWSCPTLDALKIGGAEYILARPANPNCTEGGRQQIGTGHCSLPLGLLAQ